MSSQNQRLPVSKPGAVAVRPLATADAAARICRAWEKGDTTLELARVASETKTWLRRGQWTQLCRTAKSFLALSSYRVLLPIGS